MDQRSYEQSSDSAETERVASLLAQLPLTRPRPRSVAYLTTSLSLAFVGLFVVFSIIVVFGIIALGKESVLVQTTVLESDLTVT